MFFEAIFENWLYEFDCIHDFGCGTGWHLLRFSQKDKTKKYYGYDWVDSSQKIINTIAKQNNIDLLICKLQGFQLILAQKLLYQL